MRLRDCKICGTPHRRKTITCSDECYEFNRQLIQENSAKRAKARAKAKQRAAKRYTCNFRDKDTKEIVVTFTGTILQCHKEWKKYDNIYTEVI